MAVRNMVGGSNGHCENTARSSCAAPIGLHRFRLTRFSKRSRPPPGAAHAVLALGLLLNAAGCRQDSDTSEPAQSDAPASKIPADDTATAQSEAVQALSALGYVDYSPEKADEDRINVVRIDRERSYPGHNLYNVSSLSSAFLVDESGEVVRSWEHQPSTQWGHCELLPNGELLIVGIHAMEHSSDGQASHYLLRMSWDGQVIWKRTMPAHHDVEVTPRGQILLLTTDPVRRAIHRRLPIFDTPLVLLSHDGEVVEKISLYDALSSRPDLLDLRIADGKKITRGGVRGVDLLHTNSIEWMHNKQLESRDPIYAAGNVLVSMRHQHAVAIIDWDAGQLVWAWGPGEILGPHDASTLENGNILLFDNGWGRGWSRVVELDPLTREIVWEYKAPTPTDFYSEARGSCQRLPNGNTLITNSNSGQVFEVTRDGDIVWEFLSPHLNDEGHRTSIIRMKRYERDYIDRILRSHGPADVPRVP